MAQANKEKQEAFRQRKRAAGYKRKQAWVRESTDWGLWEEFIGKTEGLTAGWSGAKMTGLFKRLMLAVETEAREGESGQKE